MTAAALPVAAARAAYADYWLGAVAAYEEIMGPARTRYERAIATARNARRADPKAQIPRAAIEDWQRASRKASAAFRLIVTGPRQAVEAALAQLEGNAL